MSQASIATVAGSEGTPPQQTIVLQSAPGFWRSWTVRLLLAALGFSVMLNFGLFGIYREYFGVEKSFLDGDASVELRLPMNTLNVSGNPTFNGSHTAVGDLSVRCASD